MVDKLKSIWMDGRQVPWDDAKIHVLTHTFHYGLAAFEGIRSYETHDGRSCVFRLHDHIRRLFDSCHIVNFKVPHSFDEIVGACKETLAVNDLREGYVRPVVYLGDGSMGVFPAQNPVRVVIAVWKWGAYLGNDAVQKGIRAKISSFTRYAPNTMMTRAKLTGNYTTSVLAKSEARSLGFDEAIMLDTDGFVAEGTGENIFIVRGGKIKTTPLTCVLPGITRDSVMTLAAENGLEIVEQRFSRDELYIADEVFFSGTAAEISPIREVDGRVIGAGIPGPVTQKIQSLFFDAVRGKSTPHADWLEEVSFRAPAAREARRAVKIK